MELLQLALHVLVSSGLFCVSPLLIADELAHANLYPTVLRGDRKYSRKSLAGSSERFLAQRSSLPHPLSPPYFGVHLQLSSHLYLHQTEVLDEFDENRVLRPQGDPSFLGFKDATFAWLREETADINVRNFRIHLDVEFVPGINIISGPTGSGKSSVLQALLVSSVARLSLPLFPLPSFPTLFATLADPLRPSFLCAYLSLQGEMHFEPTSIDSTFNLPRSKGVAYVPQEPWLQNATIRDNVCLDLPYEGAGFEKVVYACGLSRDLEILAGGDQTEVCSTSSFRFSILLLLQGAD